MDTPETIPSAVMDVRDVPLAQLAQLTRPAATLGRSAERPAVSVAAFNSSI
jgi:hypothetical protein